MARSEKRTEFLLSVFVTAMEHAGYGQFYVEEYDPDAGTAVIAWHDEPETLMPVDLDTIAKGIGIIDRAVLREITDYEGVHKVWHNAETGQRLYMGDGLRSAVLLASRTNFDDGDLDTIDALAVLECAVFGAVTYA
jgi:hypothetical protein